MSTPVRRLCVNVAAGLLVAVAAWLAAPLVALRLNLMFALLAGTAFGVLGWLVGSALNDSEAVTWPSPQRTHNCAGGVKDVGITQAMTILRSADHGSRLSIDDTAQLLTEVTSRQLVARGADPANPFRDAASQLSADLLGYCGHHLAGEPAPRLTQRRLDAYLKEIVSLWPSM